MDILELFPTKVSPEPNTGCWIWYGGITKDGYGRLRTKSPRRMTLAHRYSLTLSGVDVPSAMNVCHLCDEPSCVNPQHLFVGTQRDNMQDCSRKKRFNSRQFSKNPKAKLSAQQFSDVLSIRRRFKRGEREALASRLGVTVAAISSLRSRHNFRTEAA